MKIVFNNGKEIQVHEAIVHTLSKRLEEGCSNMQIFSYPDTSKTYLIINVSEISYITQ